MKEDNDYGDEVKKQIVHWISVGVIALMLLIPIFGSMYTIPAGYRGVITTFGKPTLEAQGEGFHFKIPIVQSINKMSVQTQKYVVEKASAASSDLQLVTTDITVNYRINPDSTPYIYRDIGMNYQDVIIAPAVLEILKASTAQYDAADLVNKRPEVKELIDRTLTDRLKQFNIIVQAVSITNFAFSPEYEASIENKVVSVQNAEAAKNKLAQIEYEAQQRIAQAKGEAEAIQIQAQAINAQGGKDYVQLQAINRWDGKLPIVFGSNAMPFIDMRTIAAAGTVVFNNTN